MDGEPQSMQDAEAQLLHRIEQLRARARAARPQPQGDPGSDVVPAAVPDLRTLLARAESHVDELRTAAAGLEQSLPGRLERAVERALADQSASQRLNELREVMRALSRKVEQVNRDLLAERLGRVEDLELLLDLFSTGIASVRGDIAALAHTLDRVEGGVDDVAVKLEQPLHVTVERTAGDGPPAPGGRSEFRRSQA